MKKLDDLKKNPLHDQEDEYRNPMEGRSPWMLAIVIVLTVGIVFFAMGYITNCIRLR